jgi:carbon monoxide dehydrogenase subunit G
MSIRHHRAVTASPEEVWSVVRDSSTWPSWFPGINAISMQDDGSRLVRVGAVEVVEDILTVDDGLRRFRYSIRPGAVPVTAHVATIDVLPQEEGSLIVYSVDVEPAALRPSLDQATSGAVESLASRFDQPAARPS